MTDDRKTLLKKWMSGRWDKEEEKRFLCHPAVEREMRSQWEKADETISRDLDREKRIWKKIENRTGRQAENRFMRFYRITAIAASLLLLIGIGMWMYQETRRPSLYTYVVTSGIRCIEPVALPDGTQVRLGPNSRLTYPQSFDGENREVELTGQAFFSVAKNKDKPFIVRTPNMDVTAIGTAFEVFNYTYENKLETILLEGKVKVDVEDPVTTKRQAVFLTPDEMLVYDKQNNRVQVKPVDAGVYSAWREKGILTFENERLSRILSRLEPWFGQKIKCSKEIAEKYRFTFKVRDESLERILFILSNASPVKYRTTDDGYELYIGKNK